MLVTPNLYVVALTIELVHRILSLILLVLRSDGDDVESEHEHQNLKKPLSTRPVTKYDDLTACIDSMLCFASREGPCSYFPMYHVAMTN